MENSEETLEISESVALKTFKPTFVAEYIKQYVEKNKTKFFSIKLFVFILLSPFIFYEDEAKGVELIEKAQQTITRVDFFVFIRNVFTFQPNNEKFMRLHSAISTFLKFYFEFFELNYKNMEEGDKKQAIMSEIKKWRINGEQNLINKSESILFASQNNASSSVLLKDSQNETKISNEASEQEKSQKTEDENPNRLYKPKSEGISDQASFKSDKIDSSGSCLYEIIEYLFSFLKKTKNEQIIVSKNIYHVLDYLISPDTSNVILENMNTDELLVLFYKGIDNYNSYEAKEVLTIKNEKQKYKSKTEMNGIKIYINNYRNLSSFILNAVKFINLNLKFALNYRINFGTEKINHIITITESLRFSISSLMTKIYQTPLESIFIEKRGFKCTIKYLQVNFAEYARPENHPHQVNLIIENIKEIISIYRNFRQLCNMSEYPNMKELTDENCAANETFKMLHSVNNFFLDEVYPILKHYIRKGNGEICDFDINNVLKYFKSILENHNNESYCSFINEFRYALSSISDIIQSKEFENIFFNQEVDEILKNLDIKMFKDYKEICQDDKIKNKIKKDLWLKRKEEEAASRKNLIGEGNIVTTSLDSNQSKKRKKRREPNKAEQKKQKMEETKEEKTEETKEEKTEGKTEGKMEETKEEKTEGKMEGKMEGNNRKPQENIQSEIEKIDDEISKTIKELNNHIANANKKEEGSNHTVCSHIGEMMN